MRKPLPLAARFSFNCLPERNLPNRGEFSPRLREGGGFRMAFSFWPGKWKWLAGRRCFRKTLVKLNRLLPRKKGKRTGLGGRRPENTPLAEFPWNEDRGCICNQNSASASIDRYVTGTVTAHSPFPQGWRVADSDLDTRIDSPGVGSQCRWSSRMRRGCGHGESTPGGTREILRMRERV